MMPGFRYKQSDLTLSHLEWLLVTHIMECRRQQKHLLQILRIAVQSYFEEFGNELFDVEALLRRADQHIASMIVMFKASNDAAVVRNLRATFECHEVALSHLSGMPEVYVCV